MSYSLEMFSLELSVSLDLIAVFTQEIEADGSLESGLSRAILDKHHLTAS